MLRLKVWFAGFATALIVLTASIPAMAEKAVVPDIILKGAKAYIEQGAGAGVEAWLEGSPIGSVANMKMLVKQAEGVEAVYGRCIGYGIIKVVPFTPDTSKVYFEMDFEKGPLFFNMLTYKSNGKWIVTGKFDMNTDPAQIFPDGMLH